MLYESALLDSKSKVLLHVPLECSVDSRREFDQELTDPLDRDAVSGRAL